MQNVHNKIFLKNLYKIFGPHPELAIDYLNQAKNKDEIFDQVQTSNSHARNEQGIRTFTLYFELN